MTATTMTHGAALGQIEAEVLTLLRRVRRSYAKSARLVHPDLSTAGYTVLLQVAEHEPTRAADVVEHLDMDKGSVSRQVTHLEQIGLVSRVGHPEDGRAHHLVLSAEGRRRMEALRRHRRRKFEQRLADWAPEDLTGFAEQLGRYNAALEL